MEENTVNYLKKIEHEMETINNNFGNELSELIMKHYNTQLSVFQKYEDDILSGCHDSPNKNKNFNLVATSAKEGRQIRNIISSIGNHKNRLIKVHDEFLTKIKNEVDNIIKYEDNEEIDRWIKEDANIEDVVDILSGNF